MAKGVYIYQQIELTTAQWAVNETVYPPSVWLFERLENGKFNMKLSDGVHKFSELTAVLQDVVAEIESNTDTEYILKFVTANGTIYTPNLRTCIDVAVNDETRLVFSIRNGDKVILTPNLRTGIKVLESTAESYKLSIRSGDQVITTPNLKGSAHLKALTLAKKPTEATLTYTEDGVETAYVIGQMVRVPDIESEYGYTFYQLYDVKDGAAVWAEGGGGSDMREKVRIVLSSNQVQPDGSLIGAAITVTDNTLGQEVLHTTWQGQELIAKVTALSAYTVTVGEVEGYATPEEQSFEASIQGDRNATFVYNSCAVTVSLDSNQIDKTDIAGAKVTVSYGDKNVEAVSGGTVKVPMGESVTVSASAVSGYATPSVQTFTAGAAGKELSMTYNTCVLTVNISGLKDGDTAQSTVSYAGGSDQTIDSGVSCKVPYGVPVTVSVQDMEGYGKPDNQTFTPDAPGKIVEMVYVDSLLKVTIDSNQPDKGDLAGLKATVSWNGQAGVQVGSGEGITIPVNAEVTITFPDLVGYKKPDNIKLTNTGGLVEKTGTYETELATVTLNADNAASMKGQTVTINNTTYTYQGSPISVKVPFGTDYSVSASDKAQYVTPEAQNFTAGQSSRDVTMTYAYNPIKYSYITLNQTITDPAAMLSGDINGEAVQLIRQNSHRVLGKYTASGEMTYCRLKDDDGAKYHDGTEAVLTGGEGDVFVKLPSFYWKVTTESTDVFKIGLAYGGNPGIGWNHWDGNALIGAYEAYQSSGKVYSRSKVVPTFNVSQSDFKSRARSRGAGYRIVDWGMHCMMAMLYYCQYGHMNCQTQIGAGTSSYPKVAGATDVLGMTDTVAGGNGDSGSINFWGLENWWGDLYEWMDNIVVDAYAWTITEPDGTTRNAGTGYSSNGYVGKMILGDYFDLICKAVSGSSTTGYCDHYYQSSSAARVVLRSCYGSDTSGGVAYADAYHDATGAYSSIGSRLAFRGDLVEAGSVSAFKALQVAN